MRNTSIIAAIFLFGCNDYTLNAKPDDTDLPGDTGTPTDTDVVIPTPPPTPPADAPDIEVEPTSLSFGFLPSQCLSEPELVTVRNVGGADLVVNDIFWLSNSGAFNETGSATTIPPGQSYQFFVDFIAPAQGDWSDQVRIASNDPDESTFDVPVSGTGANAGTITDGFAQNAAGQIDVLFVLDNSGSMSSNLQALADEFPAFVSAFVALGLDYQIGIVSTDMDNPAQSGRLVGPIVSNATVDPVAEFTAQATGLGSSGSADERGLDAAFAALDPSAGLIGTTNAGLVRPGSNLSIIVLSDENDSSNITANAFATWLNAYQGDPDLTSLSIVGGPKTGLFPCFTLFTGVSASPVPKYWNVAQQTGGIHLNLCNVGFSTIVTELANIAAGLRTSYALQALPGDSTSIEVVVDGVTVPENANNGWTYDPATNTVLFNGTAVPDEGSDVVITYEGETVCPN